MRRIGILRLGRTALLAGFVAGGLATSTNLTVTPVQAQASVSVGADFRVALEPYGAWRHHRRFGEVWVPASRARDWRPYTVGHWVYTDACGWYWVAATGVGCWTPLLTTSLPKIDLRSAITSDSPSTSPGRGG
jgi:hypothetical protein